MNSASSKNVNITILIIDDIRDHRHYLEAIFLKQGYCVSSLADGISAIEIVQHQPPDIILLDVFVSPINGYEICQQLKQIETIKHIPIIFLNSVNQPCNQVKAFEAGGVDLISKPYYSQEVITKVKHHLTIQNQQMQLKHEIKKRQLSDNLLECVLNSSLDGVAAFAAVRNQQDKIIDFTGLLANPQAVMMVESNTNSLIGKSLLNQGKNNLLTQLFSDLVEVVENCIVLEKELYYQSNSLRGWFHVFAVKLSDGFTITIRDITEKKQTEIALKNINKHLHRQAHIDSLTQLANRRQFDYYLPQEWQRCSREQQPLSIILCDVDYFKRYNDHYGHQAGDRCLAKLGLAIAAAIKRPADLAVRYGGEEFAVVLPHTDNTGAVQVAQAIRRNVKDLKIPHLKSEVNRWVTVSLGIATTIPHPYGSSKVLVHAADCALYRAKNLGRDRLYSKNC